jgi:16S rRNA (uracil1498-N3)-methyltransferase
VSAPRIYQPFPLAVQSVLKLDENASHHLARVLRAKIGDSLVIFNGQGGEYSAIITHIDKKNVEVKMETFLPREAESPLKIHLAQGIARGEKMDFIIQKAVELGAASIIPLITERCNVRLDNEREAKRLQHWQSVIISACEQSGRNRLPEIESPRLLKSFLPQVKADYRFVLTPHVDKKMTAHISRNASIVLLIGPEGGLSDEEVDSAIKNGFIPLNLGPRILRTETAPLAAIATLQARYGDFNEEVSSISD